MNNRIPNNKYLNCPAHMSDGRLTTDYRPKCDRNLELMKQADVDSNAKYRQWLNKNAVNIIDKNIRTFEEKNACKECNATSVPVQNICTVNRVNMSCETVNPDGIGTEWKGEWSPFISHKNKLRENTTLGEPTITEEGMSFEHFINPTKFMKEI